MGRDCTPDVMMGDPPLEAIQACWPFTTLHIPKHLNVHLSFHVPIVILSLSDIGCRMLPHLTQTLP